jgi:hypothetical protein
LLAEFRSTLVFDEELVSFSGTGSDDGSNSDFPEYVSIVDGVDITISPS